MLVLTGWCSAIGTDAWVSSRAINPCLLETGGALAVVLALLITVIQSAAALKNANAHRREGTREKGPIGISGGELGLILGTLFVGGIHAMHLVAVVSGWSPPFHTFFHSAMLVTWVSLASAVIYTSKVHVVLDMRVTTFVALIAYVVLLETYWSLYRVVDAFPIQYVRSLIWSLMLQSVVTLLLVVLDWKRHKVVRPPPGYQPIPDGVPAAPDHDPEAATKDAGTFQPVAPAAGAAGPLPRAGSSPEIDPDSRLSWLTIFWDSCVAVWPEKRSLQLRVLLAFILLMIMRVLNLAVPILYKKLVDSLAAVSASDGGASEAWVLWGWLSPWILFYLVAIFFQGGAGGGMVGAINNLRQVLWIPVSQDAFRRISLRIFGHVLGLDLNFHLGRKTGEVTKQIDRGTNAMQNILSTILFSIVPTCIDVLTASTYLAQALEPSVAVTVFLTVGSYIPVTILITEWRGALRREMNQTDQAMSARVTDALLNYETVHYFTNEAHEAQQYEKAIDDYQRAEFKAMASVNLLNFVQSMIMWVGISIGLLVCSAGVHRGDLTVGDVVLFLQLMAQLYGPLNWFGSYYRVMQQYTIDMENLFQLLDKKSQIEDRPEAKELVVRNGKVEYDSVWFQYEGRAPVLKNVSFVVPAGKTIAFVGATGSGKSTVTRLMFRFYDVGSGAIRVDDMDIRDVTQKSLRTAVGMVPQDTVLFNDTIMMNIRYGRLSATDQEVYAVAEAACIHEAITTRFPKGYQTMVGERGLRLSGGEKQRVAFARALLKNPTILVLDEATSALDTLTERKIQAALVASRAQRTTLIVAHRLSTIVDADMIVVMHLGEVRELGSHNELLAKAGLYAELWHKQLQSSAIDQGEGEHTHIEDVTDSASKSTPAPSTASPATNGAASAAVGATPVSSTVAAGESVQGSPGGARGESSSRGGRRGGKKSGK